MDVVRWVPACVVVLAACGRGEDAQPALAPGTATAPAVGPALPAPSDAAPPVDARTRRKVARARPCEGAPLALVPHEQHSDLRFALAGEMAYVTDNRKVSRYRVVLSGEDGCTLEPDVGFGASGHLKIPKMRPAGFMCDVIEVLTWQFLIDPAGPIYAFEQCRGMHRIDRGRFEPGCPGDFDASRRRIATTLRDASGALRTGCDAIVSADLALMPNGDRITQADRSGPVLRESTEGAILATYGVPTSPSPGGICVPVAGAAPCGDGLCLVDSGCMRIVRFTLDGRFVEEWSYRDRDEMTSLNRTLDVTRLPDGSLLMLQWFGTPGPSPEKWKEAVFLTRVAASALEP